MQTHHYLYLSLLINVVLVFFLILWEIVFRKQTKEFNFQETIIKSERELNTIHKALIKNLENKILKLELELQNKKGTIKHLSDQNIILNNEVGNIEKYYAENSEAIKKDRLKKGTEKFIQILQTSK